MDEIVDSYYNLDEFVSSLQIISQEFEGKISKDYIEKLDALWNEANDERGMLEEKVQEIEQGELIQQEYDYCSSRI